MDDDLAVTWPPHSLMIHDVDCTVFHVRRAAAGPRRWTAGFELL